MRMDLSIEGRGQQGDIARGAQNACPFEDLSTATYPTPALHEERKLTTMDTGYEEAQEEGEIGSKIAASRIQKAWRRTIEGRVRCKMPQNCSILYNEETRHKYYHGVETNESSWEHPKSRNVAIDPDTEPRKSSIGLAEESSLASSLEKSVECKSNIEEKGVAIPQAEQLAEDLSYTYDSKSPLLDEDLYFEEDNSKSEPSHSTKNFGNTQQRNDNHLGKKIWWRSLSTAGDQSRKKTLKSGDNLSGKAVELVKKVVIFKLMEEHVLDAICERLCFKVYTKNRKIFREKKPIEHMLFIVSGKLESQGNDGTTWPLEEYCGEGLLSWHMTNVNTSRRISSGKYPLSTRTVKCITNVEAFSLDSNALKYITTHYKDAFTSRHVQAAMRYFSSYWRSSAANQIQKAWRSMKERRTLACDEQRKCFITSDKETRPEPLKLENDIVDQYRKPAISSKGITQREALASSFKEFTGDRSNVTENDTKNSTPDWTSKSDFGTVELENNDHVGRKSWWRPLIKLGSDEQAKKIGWRILKPGGDNSGSKKVGRQPVSKEDHMIPPLEGVANRFKHKQLRVATGEFSEESKLGSGSFGAVYRGVLPSSGIPVAVKRMKGFSTHSKGVKEFATKVSFISQLKHENLIPILGCCEDLAKKEYLVVYEFMPNGNLANALFGPGGRGTTWLSWQQRFNIVIGIADALEYLHEGWQEQVIHGDIKPSNILLDKEWDAKLGDVGLAPLAHQHSTSTATTVVPTIGYTAPEGFTYQKFTDKTDVFAFGAIVLEIACGRKAVSDSVPPEETILVDWVWSSLSEGDLLSVVDKRLGDYDNYSMEVLLVVGLLCSHPDPLARPSMRQVVQVLAGDAPVPSIPTSKPTPPSGCVPQSISINDNLHRCNEGVVMQFQGIPQRFSYKQLREATAAFSKESKLGQGGFGGVYRGVVPSSNIPVAVKKMNGHLARDQGAKEFMTEVSIIIRLRHRNLIELLGWCEDAAKKEYLLVYELMPNGSLDDKLFGKQATCLSWSQRFNIVKGTAAALEYLHEGWKQQVIHRDIKCSNILLDKEWNAQLGDFGLARIVDHQRGAAIYSVAGTMGYIAPEVLADGTFTDKADVFGFGAVVLEVACGRRVSPVHPEKMGLVDWVWHCLSAQGDLLGAVDKRLGDSYDTYWMKVLLMVGLLCTHPDPFARPSMRQVVLVLADVVPVPSIPSCKPIPVFSAVPHTLSIDDLPGKKSNLSTSGSMASTEVSSSAPALTL